MKYDFPTMTAEGKSLVSLDVLLSITTNYPEEYFKLLKLQPPEYFNANVNKLVSWFLHNEEIEHTPEALKLLILLHKDYV